MTSPADHEEQALSVAFAEHSWGVEYASHVPRPKSHEDPSDIAESGRISAYSGKSFGKVKEVVVVVVRLLVLATVVVVRVVVVSGLSPGVLLQPCNKIEAAADAIQRANVMAMLATRSEAEATAQGQKYDSVGNSLSLSQT